MNHAADSWSEIIDAMKIGDKVRLVSIPTDIEDHATQLTFERCLGHDFAVSAIHANGFAELQVEAITGTSGDLIFVSPRFLKILSR